MDRFDKWNNIKKDTNSIKRNIGIKVREIYWVKLGQNIGDEEYGKGENFLRPVLVIRGLTKDLFLGIPTTSKIRSGKDYFHTIYYKDNLNRNITSSCMLLQLKTFSKKRILNKIGKINESEFKIILEKIKKMIDPT